MKLTVIGGSGGIPGPGTPCSGYLISAAGYRLLIDPGYGVATALAAQDPSWIDAVLVSHAHPDHCADVNPILRAVAWATQPRSPLPLYAPPAALDAVLALDRPEMLDGSYQLTTIKLGATLDIGPFRVETAELPHPRPNAGFRITADGGALVYTGDCGPSPQLVRLARGADLFLAEASYAAEVPAELRGALSSARDAGQQATRAAVRSLVLTHLMPATDPDESLAVAREEFRGPVTVARPGMTFEVRPPA